jgi:hypothetical protein
MNRIAQILGGMVRGIWHGAGMPEPPAGWTFVDVTDRPAAKVGDTYDAVTDTFTTPDETGIAVTDPNFIAAFTALVQKNVLTQNQATALLAKLST